MYVFRLWHVGAIFGAGATVQGAGFSALSVVLAAVVLVATALLARSIHHARLRAADSGNLTELVVAEASQCSNSR